MKRLRSPLVTLVLCLVLSSATGLAWYWQGAAILVSRARARRAAAVEATRPQKPWDFWTPEMENLERELKESRVAVAQREAAVDRREKRLAADLQELDKVRQQVESLRTEISQHITEVQTQEMGNLKTLATTYSLLSPKAAVAIFAQMDDVTVAKLLSLMKPETAAALLEEISRTPGENNANLKRAADLSQRLRLLVPGKPSA
jgi:flagellar motility protein MotE (MotC chaperone)